jgi:hypothetical protein
MRKTLPSLALLLLLGAAPALQAAAPSIPSSLTGRYLPVRSVVTINGSETDLGDDINTPMTVERNFLKAVELPAASRSLALVIQRTLREEFPDARLTATKTSSSVKRIEDGYTYARNDALFLSIPSVKVTGKGRMVLTGSLKTPGTMRSTVIVTLALKGPAGKTNVRIVMVRFHKKKGT